MKQTTIMLYFMLPLVLNAAGTNATGGLSDNYNLQDEVQNNDWPVERVKNGERKWFHSDIKNVAYLYLHQIFTKIQRGN